MGSVYANALFTIIAAAGDSADAGLPVNLKGITLMSVLEYKYDQEHTHGEKPRSTWFSRAWTLQEHIFSSRKLKFSDKQVYWLYA